MVSTGQVQPVTRQNAGGVSKNSPVLQTLPVSLPGGVGSVPAPTQVPEGEYTRSEKAAIAR